MEDVGGVAQHGEDDYAGQQARQKVQRGHQVGINMHSEHTQKLESKIKTFLKLYSFNFEFLKLLTVFG